MIKTALVVATVVLSALLGLTVLGYIPSRDRSTGVPAAPIPNADQRDYTVKQAYRDPNGVMCFKTIPSGYCPGSSNPNSSGKPKFNP